MIKTRYGRSTLLVLAAVALMTLVGCGGGGELIPTKAAVQEGSPPASRTPVAVAVATATESSVVTENSTVTQTPAVIETPAEPQSPDAPETSEGLSMRLTSTAFEDTELIPPLYTCDADDISPPLAWQDPPEGTRSFVLICDDPDAPGGTWVHWVMYNIPSDARSLAAGVPTDAALPDGAQQGQNSWPQTGYGGPCPPSGTHRYVFALYALDTTLELEPGDADKATLIEAIAGHVLAETTLTGRYQRQH